MHDYEKNSRKEIMVMNINIYYGGRGLIDDPTLHVINVCQEVLEELRVNVTRYNLHELKNNVTSLPHTLKEADGVILATTVEWLGINGWMQVFLDACWFFGDKEKISKIYMVPVVLSTTYGEREAQLSLVNAWEMLGGKTCKGICAYVEDTMSFELNKDYKKIIEKQAEDLYRSIFQKMQILPSSTLAIKQNILKETMDFTPQESEQLSKYASDDIYVKKQKEDIEELAGFYKDMLESSHINTEEPYIEELKKAYVGQPNIKATYIFSLEDKKNSIILEIDHQEFNCYYGKAENADVTIRMSSKTLEEIIYGIGSFQGSFMKGSMTAKGDFGLVKTLDQVFSFRS